MTEPSPRVSVILAVCNAEAYLAEAVRSVLSQTFTDFELCVHDDGSTDGSLAILESFAAADPRVRLSSGANQGLVPSLNALVARARGEYLARMDADDVCLPERLDRQVAFLDAHPDVVLLGTWTQSMDAEGRIIAPNLLPTAHEQIDARNLAGRTVLVHPTVMMRRSAFEDAGRYDGVYTAAEDLELWLRLAEVGQIANLPQILLNYRVHAGSVSARQKDLQAASTRSACEDAAARRGVVATLEFTPWRMEDSRASVRDFSIKNAWDAWNWGYLGTWRHYALKAVLSGPLSTQAWKVLLLGALRIRKSGTRARQLAAGAASAGSDA